MKNVGQFILVICIIILVRIILFDNCSVSSGSMENTLMVGDKIIINKAAYRVNLPFIDQYAYNEPKHNDIVGFYLPDYGSMKFIKRVVGVPGDVIRIENKNIFRNGEKIDEFYASYEKNTEKKDIQLIKVPQDEYFLLGDNRSNSFDSRDFGTVDKKQIFGKAVLVWFSNENYKPRLDRIGTLI